jgi:hypothetical protein
VTLNLPPGGWYNADSVVDATVTDNIAVSNVTYLLNGNVVLMTNYTGINWNATLDLSSVADGNYTITINGTDTSGNSNITSNVSDVAIDDTYPLISSLVSGDSDNITRESDMLNFTVDTTDANLKNVTLNGTLMTKNGSSDIYYLYTNASDLGCNADGNCTLTATVYDYAGNLNSTSYNLLVDDTAPVISNDVNVTVGGSSITYNNDSVYMNVTVTEALTNVSAVWISGNWTGNWTNVTLTNTGNGNYSYNISEGELQNGEVVGWIYYANDTAGNLQTGNLNSFLIVNRNPSFNGTIPALEFLEDGPEDTINLFDYFSDVDLPDDNLTFAPTTLTNYNGFGGKWIVNQTTGIVTIQPNRDYNGTDIVVFNVTDKFGLTNSSNTVNITVTGLNEAPTGQFSFTVVEFVEDSFNATIDLDDYFNDVENGIQSYTFTRVSNAENISVDINSSTHIANISAKKNWNGDGRILFTAFDNQDLTGSSNILTINVTPVNDVPVISGIPTLVVKEDSGINSSINLTNYTTDVETVSTSLTYNVTYDNTSEVDCGINADTDRLDATPVANWFGTAYCNLTATDGANISDAFQLAVSVENVNDAPVITSTANTTATEDSPYTYQATSTDIDNTIVPGTDTISYSLTTKPAGMGVDSSGLIIWQPDNDDVASHSVVLNVSDGKGGSVNQSYTVVVSDSNDAPSTPALTSPLNGSTIILENATLKWNASTDVDNTGQTTTYFVYHSNESNNITFLASTTLLNYTATGLNDSNTYYWFVIAGDGTDNSTASTTFNYNISLHNPPNITSFSPTGLSPSVAEGGSLAFSVTAEDVDGDTPLTYLWKLDSSEVSTTSAYTYTPLFNHSGAHTVSVFVNDTTKMTDTMSWSVTVNNTNRDPVLTSIGAKSVNEDSKLEFAIGSSDSDIQFGDVLTYSINDTRLTVTKINNTLANITWTPANGDVGVHSVNVSVTDNFAGVDSETIAITVDDTNDAPTITSFSPLLNRAMSEAESQIFNITYADVDLGDSITVVWTRNGTSIGGSDSVTLSGLASGSYNITATITDNASETDLHQWNLTVSNTPVVEKYTGTIDDIPENELGNATNVTIEESSLGEIDFGTNTINLTNVIDIDNAVLIGAGSIGIDTGRYPQLNESAHIVMKGLSFETDPVIFYNPGFGVSGNTACPSDICENIVWNSGSGTLEFDVAHFSTFFVTTNNRPTANAGPDQIVRAGTGVVTLTGSASSDPDNDTLTYQWTQVSGLGVSLSNSTSSGPTFTQEQDGTYIFELIVNDGTISSLPDNVTVTIFGSVLSIDKVTLKSDDKDKELKPGEDLTVKVKIENNGDFDIEDIEVNVWFVDSAGRKLEDDDSDDIEEEEEFDLDEGDSETIEFDFTDMPFDVEDGDDYTVHVTAEGKNADNNSLVYLDIDESKTIEFVRERHEIEIFEAVLAPSTVKCSRSINVEVGVRNIGEKEEDVVLMISSSQLDINKQVTFELSEDLDDDDSRNDDSYGFIVGKDVEAGVYPVNVRAEYGSKSETKILNLEVIDCEKVVKKKEEVFIKKEPVKKDVTAKREGVVTEPVVVSFKDSSAYLILLVNSFILLTGIVVLLIGMAVVKLRRR